MKRYGFLIGVLLALATVFCSAYVTDVGEGWRIKGAVIEDCTLTGTTASTLAAVKYEDADWYYVDSAATGDADGSNWDDAVVTLDAAINKCTGATQYVILVNAGHTEALTGADGVDIDVANVTIIGMGIGSAKPVFDYTNAAGEFVIGAANVKVVNLAFLPNVNVVTKAIDVENGGDFAQIVECDFLEGSTAGTDEFVDCVIVGTTATDVLVKGCTYFGTGANANTFVNLDAATIANATVRDCKVFGAFLESAVWWAAAVPTNLSVIGNVITNTDADQSCVEGSGVATGVCIDNQLTADTYGAVLLPGRLRCSGNTQCITVGGAAEDVPLLRIAGDHAA